MDVGDPIEVHTRFNDAWVPGFEVAEVTNAGYRVRRVSDGELLPEPTSERDLRPMSPPESSFA